MALTCVFAAGLDGIENKLAATAFTADPAERFGYGLRLFLDGIRQQLALLPFAAQEE